VQGEALPPQQHDEDMSDMMTYGGFLKWGIPNFWMVYNGKLFIMENGWFVMENGWFIMEHPNLKWMIWGYPYSRKPTYYNTIIHATYYHTYPT